MNKNKIFLVISIVFLVCSFWAYKPYYEPAQMCPAMVYRTEYKLDSAIYRFIRSRDLSYKETCIPLRMVPIDLIAITAVLFIAMLMPKKKTAN